ncbi:ethanolamine ammonia-lyase subunit EutB [Corallococcus sp. bb12-1]|uniref:ethanolamine ammonia-lyase subunit EutB n=1 Tax=Corallococcus sp. bb12-1 TaxID=2996784 RepID=UPI002271B4B8|nr:ethanolamine ammonia-lyase subunit EutB [Corallococcus sp. bb12-1]MCY1045547.1 ethanolamine ammonia-lyase subunit EutB [Corallococcus sp. bb12-1]
MSVSLPDVLPEEDVLDFVQRQHGAFDARLYQQVLGAANAFKEGDEAIGVAAADEASRQRARTLLSRTRLDDVHAHPPFEDRLHVFSLEAWDAARWRRVAGWTLGQLKDFLLTADEASVHDVLDGLPSDVIACVVKLMSDAELKAVGGRVFHPLPGSRVGARGYLGARLQPNSPTDHPEDIRWQVFNGWAFAVGDVVLGTNPVSSDPKTVAAVEAALHDVLVTFGLTDVMPHCVLAHIDVQAQVEALHPGTTGIWFQSLGGNEAANRTFDVTLEKMVAHAASRTGRWGLYFETGQGADATNGHHHGTDMLIHESRKYGFARALKRRVAVAQGSAGRDAAPWVHVNDVAGFIGPEVFRTREQLVRCCLEDIVMGKLHGLTLGLDVCSTLHMDVTLDDLGWCQEQLAEAGPAYLMALPTRNDPMLSYLTTSFQDHVRLRERYGLKVDDRMWAFFQGLGVIDAEGRPTQHFGDPRHVYVHYRRRLGDTRPEVELRTEAEVQMARVRARGVPLAVGHGKEPWTLEPALEQDLRRLYEDAKVGLWSELSDATVESLPGAVRLRTCSEDRRDYILHPPSGESLDGDSEAAVRKLRERHGGRWDAQLVVSDGLDPRSLMDAGHLSPFLDTLRAELGAQGWSVAPEVLVVKHGRVRAGYQVGRLLFGDEGDARPRALVHVIGERPGSGHHAYSAYLTAPAASTWARQGAVDHDRTRLIAGISDTSVRPEDAAREAVRILSELATTARTMPPSAGDTAAMG